MLRRTGHVRPEACDRWPSSSARGGSYQYLCCRYAYSSGGSSGWHTLANTRRRASRHRLTPQAVAGSSSSTDLRMGLRTALVQQIRKEAVPWIQELVQPWLDGRPAPLTDTVSPQELADEDSKFITVDGVQLHYKECYSAAGGACDNQLQQEPLTLLLLHGFNGSTFNWRLVMQGLADRLGQTHQPCRVIAFDRPPFGLSGRPLTWDNPENSPYTQAAGVRFATGLLRQLGVPRAVVAGHSAGAGVAVEMALTHPEMVTGLVLVAPALTVESKGFLSRADFGQLARFFYTRALLNTDWAGLNYIRRQIYKRSTEVKEGRVGTAGGEGAVALEAIDGYLKPMKAHDWDRASLLMYRSFALPSPANYQDVTASVLVVQGDKDRAVPKEMARAVTKRFEGRAADLATQYVELSSCGHIPMEEQPAEFMAAAVSFIQGGQLSSQGLDQPTLQPEEGCGAGHLAVSDGAERQATTAGA